MTPSYSKGPDPALREQTIWETFAGTAARFPDRVALISRHQNIRWSFLELSTRAEDLARGLCGLGLVSGDRVGIWSTNCAEWVLLQLACARAGLVLVNVNPSYRSWELSYVLKKSRIRALFLWASDRRAEYRAILAECENQPEHAVYFGEDSWDRVVGPKPSGRLEAYPTVDDVANIQYTSGTTGSPKGVLLTHHNLVNNGYLISRTLQATELDLFCLPVPMYHCFGSVMGAMVSYNTGAGILFPAPTFDARATLEAIHEERATAIYGVPTMFIAELDCPNFAAYDLSSLRTGIMAGAPCPVHVMKRVMVDMHCPEITIGYGQTESSPIVTMSDVTDSVELRTSTVGRAMPETEIKIVSVETGETLLAGEQGELCARGYMIMRGYDADPDATAKAIDSEGWLHTGDLAVMREDGYFKITGRARDMIIRGGENIYPREVEEFLYTHPKVAEVQVVGLPDARLGETVLAWIRLKSGESSTEEEIRDHCRGKIAHFKVPQHVRFVDEFPTTVTGKIQKFRIREIETEKRGLQQAAGIETA